MSAPPPRCAVGVVSLLDHAPSPRSLTCILCQEESKDTNSQEKPFVQAVFVQRSAVLRRGSYDEEGEFKKIIGKAINFVSTLCVYAKIFTLKYTNFIPKV